MAYLDINPEYFRNELAVKFRSSYLWEKIFMGYGNSEKQY